MYVLCVRTYICTYVQEYVSMHMCMYVCVYMGVFVCVCMYVYGTCVCMHTCVCVRRHSHLSYLSVCLYMCPLLLLGQ